MTSFERALLIVNPVAGHGRGLRLGQQLRESLESRGAVCSVRVTSGQGDAQRWAEAAGGEGDGGPFDLIVAIGGDGTVSEIVSGQARSEMKVAIAMVPVGTANVVAIALSLPWFPGMAAGNIQDGRIVPFDVGYLPLLDRHFLLMAAIGYPARVIQDSPRRLKNLFGIFTYIVAGFRNALKLDVASIFIEDENEKVHEFVGNTILLSNIGKIGDINLKVTPDTSAHDGLPVGRDRRPVPHADLALQADQKAPSFPGAQGGDRHGSAGAGADRRRGHGTDPSGGRDHSRRGASDRRRAVPGESRRRRFPG